MYKGQEALIGIAQQPLKQPILLNQILKVITTNGIWIRVLGGGAATLSNQKVELTELFRGSKSCNKVPVGEPIFF